MEQKTIRRNKIILGNSSFTMSANQSNYESEVATYSVPQNRVVEIPNEFIGLKLMTKQTFSFTTASGVTTQTLTTTYPIATDANIPMVGQNVIVVITTPATGEVTTFTVTTPNTVTLSGLTASTSYVVDVYYMFNSGQAKITVTSSDETAVTTLLSRNIGNLNATDQNDVRSGLKPGQLGLIIPERSKIQLKVITAAPIFLYAPGAETAYSSVYARQSFLELPANISSIFDWPSGIKGFAKQQQTGI
jgi:hypothetical protein